MQAIHNLTASRFMALLLFQRAKIQDKCKQFTTHHLVQPWKCRCFKEQRYKINASNSQPLTILRRWSFGCFKEQRYKINASNSQLICQFFKVIYCCFKEQRYKINASNSQQKMFLDSIPIGCFKEQRYKINASNSQQWLTQFLDVELFQRAKIQDKCKQFTTIFFLVLLLHLLFQRAKIQDKCKQFTTWYVW